MTDKRIPCYVCNEGGVYPNQCLCRVPANPETWAKQWAKQEKPQLITTTCPDCGGTESYDSPIGDDLHKICKACRGEWYTDLNYKPTTKKD